MEPDPRRPDGVQLLELNGRMSWIAFEEFKRLVCRTLNLGRQAVIAHPEGRCGVVLHNSVERPAS